MLFLFLEVALVVDVEVATVLAALGGAAAVLASLVGAVGVGAGLEAGAVGVGAVAGPGAAATAGAKVDEDG